MIEIRDLSLNLGASSLRDISFAIPAGAHAVLMGRTGSGKTSLLEAICGLRPIDSGAIVLDGKEVSHLPPGARGIGYVPQDVALFPSRSVREHLTLALEIRGWSVTEMNARVQELAELLGISALLERRPEGLSGGESQRVAIGRALSFRPSILCLDEPLSALDDQTRAEMYALLESLRRQTSVTILHVTHSYADGQRLADLTLMLEGGRVVPVRTG
jgi:molybdate/tungstate transport system ATP-binding protein